MNYTNARHEAHFTDWPHGSLRTSCTFKVETVKGKQRASRVTVDPKTGRPSKPKTTTYAPRVAIMDGDDGRTYIVEVTMYGSISVMQSNLQFQAETIPSDDPRCAPLRAAVEAVGV